MALGAYFVEASYDVSTTPPLPSRPAPDPILDAASPRSPRLPPLKARRLKAILRDVMVVDGEELLVALAMAFTVSASARRLAAGDEDDDGNVAEAAKEGADDCCDDATEVVRGFVAPIVRRRMDETVSSSAVEVVFFSWTRFSVALSITAVTTDAVRFRMAAWMTLFPSLLPPRPPARLAAPPAAVPPLRVVISPLITPSPVAELNNDALARSAMRCRRLAVLLGRRATCKGKEITPGKKNRDVSTSVFRNRSGS